MPNCRVLVVEDEMAIAELVAINLQYAGFEVILASDGWQAQAAVARVLPSLIILDWMLPGQSGIELARQWRQDPRTQTLPIIMITGRSDEIDIIVGLDAGADDYLTKPFSPTELLARINALLRRRAPEFLDSTVVLGPLSIDPSKRRLSAHGTQVRLQPTEFKILHFLMTYPDQVHTRKSLLDRIWGDHVFI